MHRKAGVIRLQGLVSGPVSCCKRILNRSPRCSAFGLAVPGGSRDFSFKLVSKAPSAFSGITNSVFVKSDDVLGLP